MKFIAVSVLVAAVAITGCASIIDGKNQTMTLSTKNNNYKDSTECDLMNSNGVWTTDHKESIVVRRDYDDLIINCENEKQKGQLVVESSASVGFMIANFFIWDLCTISCIIDHSTGALYEYPITISVPMRDKESDQPITSGAKINNETQEQVIN